MNEERVKELPTPPYVAGSVGRIEIYRKAAELSGTELIITPVGKDTLFISITDIDPNKFKEFVQGIIEAYGGIREYAKPTRPRHFGV